MFENFGQKIRTLREQKGISLNQFARNLNVSPAYLSNLETGQRTKVDLSFLRNLEKELNILSTEFELLNDEEFNEFYYRKERIFHHLALLEKSNPSAANFWLNMLEEGLQLYHNEQSSSKKAQGYH